MALTSDFLTSAENGMALFRSNQLVAHTHSSLGMMKSQLVELGEERGNGGVMRSACHSVEAHDQSVRGGVGFQIGGGDEDFTNYGSRVGLFSKAGKEK